MMVRPGDRWPAHKDPPLFAWAVRIIEWATVLLIAANMVGTVLWAIALVAE